MKIKTWICRICSKYGLLPMIAAFGYNCLVYWISGSLVKDGTLYSLAIPWDEQIPLIEWTIVIYFGCYLFWIVNYILIYRRSREKAYRFFIADFLSRTVCLLFFILYPTTIARPEVTGEGLFSGLMRLLYEIDAPVNLFPSIHCLVSWNCWVGIRKEEKIPRWYRNASLIMAVAVCVSTVTTRQHVIVDIAGGVLLSELTCWMSQRTEWWRYVERTFDKAADRLLG